METEILSFNFSDTELIKHAFEIRRTVFVVEQNCPPELEYENEEICTHYLLKHKGKYVATARRRVTENGIKLERFAVLKKYRKSGFASLLLNKILSDVAEENKKKYLHSQVHAMGLYSKAGFIAEGDMFEEAGIQHFKMVLGKEK